MFWAFESESVPPAPRLRVSVPRPSPGETPSPMLRFRETTPLPVSPTVLPRRKTESPVNCEPAPLSRPRVDPAPTSTEVMSCGLAKAPVSESVEAPTARRPVTALTAPATAREPPSVAISPLFANETPVPNDAAPLPSFTRLRAPAPVFRT